MHSRKTIAAMIVAVLAITLPARADEPSREYQVKAAFIYNFVQFVDWPASAFADDSSPITVGVLGANPFGDALDHVADGKTAHGRTLAVRYFSRIEDVEKCQVLFVVSSDRDFLQTLHDKLKDQSVLTIGEADQFLQSGGIIRIYTEENKVRFEINVDAAEQAQLKISSKLLHLAKIFSK
jgi:hypothetical protein